MVETALKTSPVPVDWTQPLAIVSCDGHIGPRMSDMPQLRPGALGNRSELPSSRIDHGHESGCSSPSARGPKPSTEASVAGR
jgi:hypothetical protein